MKTFVIDSNKIITQGCVLEQGHLHKYDVEPIDQVSITGNIYKGRVTNVNKEKRIAFIDIGLKKQGMINFKDLTKDVKLIAGQDLLVQVISDPYEEKGAKLTTELAFQGKYMVLLSGSSNIGVSRKISSLEKRNYLNQKIESLINGQAFLGAIVRTEASNADLDDFVEEYHLLENQMTSTLKYRVLGRAPRLIREQKGLLDQYLKMFNPEVDLWLTNDKRVYDYCLEKIGKKRLQYYAGHDLFDYAGCKQALDLLRAYKLPLPSGGEIVVDYTEACTVIDVNSGKQKHYRPTYDALFQINCEAMAQTKWLLEKGNIAGAIIVDLINMNSHEKKQELLEAAREIFKKSDCYVAGISALGFLEITRKRMAKPAYKIFEYSKPLNNDGLYEPNMLYYLTKFINEIRRMTEHYSGRHFRFLGTSQFIDTVSKMQIVLEDGTFYENKAITVELINDDTLKTYFKITH